MTQLRTRLVWLLVRLIPFERLRTLRTKPLWAPVDRIARSGELIVLGGLVPHLRLRASHFDYAGALAYGVITGTHEPMVQEALRRTVRPGSAVLDLGAGSGTFSLIAAALVGPAGRVVSVEPLQQNVEAIAAHAAANAFDNIEIVAAAAGASSGEMELVETVDPMWALMSKVGEHPRCTGRQVVPAVTIDELVARGEIPEPDVVKIDVEGSELDVLEGMRQLIERRHPIIIAEMHDRNAPFSALASELGYELENLDGPEPVADAGPNIHVICKPRP